MMGTDSKRACERTALPTVWGLVCSLLLLSAHSAAQDAVWIAPSIEQAHWYSQVRVALEAEGVVVRDAAPDAPVCGAPACAVEVARGLGMRFGVLVRSDAHAERMMVTLAAVDGRSGEASVTVLAGDVARATRAAYRQAELALQLGDAGLLRVQSTPEGALVTVDGEPVGHAPLEHQLSAGRHVIAVSLDGFAGQQQSVEVTRGGARELRVKLLRVAPASPPGAKTARSPLNWIVGGALVLGAVPALVIAIGTLASDGTCAHARDAAGGCSSTVHFGTRSGVLLGVGAAALVAGGYILLAGPFKIEAQADPQGARVALAARF